MRFMRPIKSAEPPAWPQTLSNAHRESLTLSLKLITPMFGGGYKAGEVDDVCRIRAATVRGHLRFWWRALYGAEYTTSNALFKAEEARWGSTEKPAAISLKVIVTSNGNSKTYSQWTSSNSALTYFLFPFQKNNQRPQEGKGYADIAFTLTLDFPTEYHDEVERTLKAWIAFGGIGARTRRGCGALTVKDEVDRNRWLPPSSASGLRSWLDDMRPLHQVSSDIPSLCKAKFAVGDPSTNAHTKWAELARFWSEFHKGQRNGRLRKWPDYDLFARCSTGSVPQTLQLLKPYLGLPINHQSFEGRAIFSGPVEPTISGRMASPVILKPLALADGKFSALVLVLTSLAPSQIAIKSEDGRAINVQIQPLTSHPNLQYLGASNPLDAVHKFALQRFNFVTL
jgi:CRISPR-associated protein Cmr1